MLPTTCGCAAEPDGTAAQSSEGLGVQVQVQVQVQEWSDGSRYEGEFVDGLKHGKGRYTCRNGEYYEGSFFKDYKHGDGLWCWPTGRRFTGRFYLNRREGYGQEIFPNGATFQGLYYRDQRFGPGVVTYPDGRQDVGLWLDHRLLKFCSSVEESFRLSGIPGYSTFLQPSASADSAEPQSFLSGLHTKDRTDLKYIDLLGDESFVLPPGIEHYSTNGDHLPLPPGRRRVLDQLFYGEQWEPDPYQGYERDLLSTLPLQARMQTHIHRHRLRAKNVGWDVAAVLSMNREGFGPKGPVEVQSELFIQHSFRGQRWDVARIFQTQIVHPDVADSQGHTALIAATVNCHNDVIHLLLDIGVDINKLNSEGMSALAVCQVLHCPFHLLHTILTKPPVMMSPSLSEITSVLSELDLTSLTPVLNNKTESRKIKLVTEEEEVDEQAEDGEAREDQETADVEHSIQDEDDDLSPKQSVDSISLLSSYDVTETFLQCSSEALNHTGFPQSVCKNPAMNIERHVRLKTLKALLERGADPNLAKVPLPVLFLGIMAGDTEVVKTLLLFGARTDVPLPPEYKGLYPLHVAAALPGPQGPIITEMLILTLLDLDVQACDEDEIYEPDRISMKTLKLLSSRDGPRVGEGGRTALHVACQRDVDYVNASKVVSILVSRSASTNLLWRGHSPLSLAIASGNHLAVQELLNGGADPNTPLGPVVGSALCALVNINYNFGENKMKMLDMLIKANADILMPVKVDGVEGTVFDYAHSILKENLKSAHAQTHTFDEKERKLLEAHQLQKAMVNLLRKKYEHMDAEDLTSGGPEKSENCRLPVFCFHCGCSISKKQKTYTQDHEVFCSRTCKNKEKAVRHIVSANMKENYSFN